MLTIRPGLIPGQLDKDWTRRPAEELLKTATLFPFTNPYDDEISQYLRLRNIECWVRISARIWMPMPAGDGGQLGNEKEGKVGNKPT